MTMTECCKEYEMSQSVHVGRPYTNVHGIHEVIQYQ